jgi:hypothetical protein
METTLFCFLACSRPVDRLHNYIESRDGTKEPRYDNVALSPLLLPARVTIRSHSTQWSSARSDSHREVFCPNSVEVVGKINGGERKIYLDKA